MDAPNDAQQPIVKGLHPEAYAADARCFKLCEIYFVYGAGVRLDGALGGHSRRRCKCLYDARQKCCGQCSRRATADVDGCRIAPPCTQQRRLTQNLCPKRRRIGCHFLCCAADGRRYKVTVAAFLDAIGDVDVDAPRLFTHQASAPP